MRITWQRLVLAALGLVVGAVLALQHQANVDLRGLIGLLRQQNLEVERLRAEQLRLVRTQISPAELESLRADHVAIVRLRSEIALASARLNASEPAVPVPAPTR